MSKNTTKIIKKPYKTKNPELFVFRVYHFWLYYL